MNKKLVTLIAVVVATSAFACGGADNTEQTATRGIDGRESSSQEKERNDQTETEQKDPKLEEGMDETRMTTAQRCWNKYHNERCWELSY